MNVSCNSSVNGNVHVDVLFKYAMIIVILLLYIDETKYFFNNNTKNRLVTCIYLLLEPRLFLFPRQPACQQSGSEQSTT